MARLEQISWKPRAYIYHSFLSEEECDYIVELARPLVTASSSPCNSCLENSIGEALFPIPPPWFRTAWLQMRRSTVVGANGKSVTDNIRTSYGTFLRYSLGRFFIWLPQNCWCGIRAIALFTEPNLPPPHPFLFFSSPALKHNSSDLRKLLPSSLVLKRRVCALQAATGSSGDRYRGQAGGVDAAAHAEPGGHADPAVCSGPEIRSSLCAPPSNASRHIT